MNVHLDIYIPTFLDGRIQKSKPDSDVPSVAMLELIASLLYNKRPTVDNSAISMESTVATGRKLK